MSNDNTKDFPHASLTAENDDFKAPADVSSEKHPLKGQENLHKKKTGNVKKALDDEHCCWPPELH